VTMNHPEHAFEDGRFDQVAMAHMANSQYMGANVHITLLFRASIVASYPADS
jgi:hypothetical protein